MGCPLANHTSRKPRKKYKVAAEGISSGARALVVFFVLLLVTSLSETELYNSGTVHHLWDTQLYTRILRPKGPYSPEPPPPPPKAPT